MKNILVPTDFSANAKDALIYALNFLRGANAKLHVLSVLSLPTSGGWGDWFFIAEDEGKCPGGYAEPDLGNERDRD